MTLYNRSDGKKFTLEEAASLAVGAIETLLNNGRIAMPSVERIRLQMTLRALREALSIGAIDKK